MHILIGVEVRPTLYCKNSSVNETTIINKTPGHSIQKRGLGVSLFEAASPNEPKDM